jgi:phosphoglycerate dehydrogenase-like enzyme
MKQLSVVISRPFPADLIRKIKDVSPHIVVTDITALLKNEAQGDNANVKTLNDILANTEILFGSPSPANIINRAQKLRWIQAMSAGVESLLTPDIINSDILVTSASGIHGTQMGELAFEMILILTKQAATYMERQHNKKWERGPQTLLHSKTLGILGLGHIGKEIARLASAFHMKVIAIDETRKTRPARNVDAMISGVKLHAFLAECDYVVVTLPLTDKTVNFLSKHEFKAMKPSAYLINIARGKIVDEDALIEALKTGKIAGAGLDTFKVEPLPLSSKLWEMPNVIITPHIGGTREDYDALVADVFCENLKRYLSGKKLLNIINKKKQY